VYNTNYHFVWSTKYRRKVLTGKIAEDLKELHEKIAKETVKMYIETQKVK
jgi:putative transposase